MKRTNPSQAVMHVFMFVNCESFKLTNKSSKGIYETSLLHKESPNIVYGVEGIQNLGRFSVCL